MPAFLSSGLSKKKTLKKADNPFFLSELKQTRRKRSVCRKEGSFAPHPKPLSSFGSLRTGPLKWCGNLPDERHSGTISLAPRIYEGGGPRSGRGSPPAAAGKASSVTAAPCQLPQRGSRGRFAPFLPPAFMRGNRFGMIPYRAIRNGLRFRFLFAGRGLTGAVYSPPEMQVSVASGRGKWGQKRALWDVHNPAPENFAMFYREKCIFRHRDRFLHLICFAI